MADDLRRRAALILRGSFGKSAQPRLNADAPVHLVNLFVSPWPPTRASLARRSCPRAKERIWAPSRCSTGLRTVCAKGYPCGAARWGLYSAHILASMSTRGFGPRRGSKICHTNDCRPRRTSPAPAQSLGRGIGVHAAFPLPGGLPLAFDRRERALPLSSLMIGFG
jgi:hypothetical protein